MLMGMGFNTPLKIDSLLCFDAQLGKRTVRPCDSTHRIRTVKTSLSVMCDVVASSIHVLNVPYCAFTVHVSSLSLRMNARTVCNTISR